MGKAQEKFRQNVVKKRLKKKRWKKGQSCVTNPEAKKHRAAAKSRFFNVNTGKILNYVVLSLKKSKLAMQKPKRTFNLVQVTVYPVLSYQS